MDKGKLIIFEGISGTGKETQAKLLQQYLSEKHIRSQIVFHPSPELKPILSQWRSIRKIDSITEVYLLLADRRSRVKQLIKPALARGEWVIGLRNNISALVYQGKTATDRKWIASEFSRFELKPDTTIFFDIAPEAALKRIQLRHRETGESLGKFETLELLAAKRQAYHGVFSNITHQTIDAAVGIDDLHQQIQKIVTQLLVLG